MVYCKPEGDAMKVLILNGSARGLRGVTGKLVKALAGGLSEGGGEVRQILAQGLNVSPCLACLSCMHKTPGECAVKDDMGRIYADLKRSDLLVVATPVYTDNMSAQMKVIIDRCICCMEPFLKTDSAGRVRHSYAWRMPAKFFLIATSGFPEMETFAPLVATFRAQADNFGSISAGEVCVPGSIALQMEPTRLDPHLALLHQAGKVMAETGGLTEETLKGLNTPPITVDQYLAAATKYEEWCRARLETAAKKSG
jgi:multimeric flavodoxin WrbA